jgi:thiol-disulfide isomerase/thioredoxin
MPKDNHDLKKLIKHLTHKSQLHLKENTIVFVYANWCGFCIRVKPEVIRLYQRYKNTIEMVAIDAGEHGSPNHLLKIVGVNSFPTFMIVKNGKLKKLKDIEEVKSIVQTLNKRSFHFRRKKEEEESEEDTDDEETETEDDEDDEDDETDSDEEEETGGCIVM